MSNKKFFCLLFYPQIVFFKALIADIHNMQPIFSCEFAEDDRIYLDGLHIRQGNSAIAVHVLINCFEQDQFIGKAHIHRFDEFHELVRHILRRDKIPAILFGNIADAFLPEIVEHPLITKGNRKVRFDFSVLDVTLHRLGLHIHHPNELDLRDHILDAVLPVKKIDDLIVGHIDRHIQPCLRLFALEQHILIQLALVLRCQHIRHGLIFCNVQHPVQAVGHQRSTDSVPG